MKLKRVIRFLMFIPLLLWATGCIEVERNIQLRSDGSGHEVTIVSTSDPMVFSGVKEAVNSDEEFIKRVKEAGGTITEKRRKDQYQLIVNRPFRNVSELNEGKSRYSLSKEGRKYNFTMFVKEKRDAEMPLGGAAAMAAFPLSIEVELPGKIVTASTGTIMGRKLLWTGTLAETVKGLRITVEGREEAGFTWLLVLITLIVTGVLGVIVYRVSIKGKERMKPIIFCGQCGFKNEADSSFCQECGAPLGKS